MRVEGKNRKEQMIQRFVWEVFGLFELKGAIKVASIAVLTYRAFADPDDVELDEYCRDLGLDGETT